MSSSDRAGDEPMIYEITVMGCLDADWSDWFDGMSVVTAGTATTISGCITDQAALRGVLRRVWDLNLTLISVTRRELHGSNR